MKTTLTLGAAIVVGALTIAATSQPAYAIRCSGITQINKHTRIITPYCEHEELARIARQYGWNTSGRRLRNNINHKAKVCEMIGHDIRLSSVCDGLRLEDRGGGRFAS
jgi:hypothetical protein